MKKAFTIQNIKKFLKNGSKLSLATQNYPSRGQSAVQELYQTSQGRFFLKQVSERNHHDCQVDPKTGTLAEREYWASLLAQKLKLRVPTLWLLDKKTTVQQWLDYPDANQYATHQGKLQLTAENIFNAALFDWISGQIDRHDANYLYNYVGQKIILIDSAHSFLKYDGSLPDYLKLFEMAYPKELIKVHRSETRIQIQKLTAKKLSQWVPLKLDVEKESLVHRVEKAKQVNTIADIIQLYREAR